MNEMNEIKEEKMKKENNDVGFMIMKENEELWRKSVIMLKEHGGKVVANEDDHVFMTIDKNNLPPHMKGGSK